MIGNSITNSGIFLKDTSHYIIDHATLYTNYAYDQMSASIPVIQNYASITNIYLLEKQSQTISFLTPLLIASINFLQEFIDSTQATAIYYHKRNPDLLVFSILFSILTIVGISVTDRYFLHQNSKIIGEDIVVTDTNAKYHVPSQAAPVQAPSIQAASIQAASIQASDINI